MSAGLVVISCPTRSAQGPQGPGFYGRFPTGNAPAGAQLLAAASDVTSAVGALDSGGSSTEVFNFTSFPTQAEATTLQTAGSSLGSVILPGTIAALMPAGAGHAANALWFNTQQNISGGFTTRFTFQITDLVNWTVCGLAFVVQNTTATLNPQAFGDKASFDANCVGYGAFNPALGSSQQPPINSIGVKFDGNANGAQGFPSAGSPNSTGLYVNGGPFGGLLPCNDLNPYGIDLYSGDVMAVTIVYDNDLELLTMVIGDTVTGAQARFVWPVNIPFACSSNLNWIGLVCGTAAEGGGSATTFEEAVSDFSWSFSTGFNPRLATPTLSPAPGSYSGTQGVTISGPSGASIFYTLNGLLPTSASLEYTGTPISVSGNEVIQVVAIQSGFTDSLVGGGAYQISTPNVVNFASGFSAGDGMILCGTAALSGSSIQLTNTSASLANTGGHVGAAWFPLTVNIEAGWSAAFQLEFTAASANGMTFCLQNNPPPFTANNQNPSWSGGPTAMGWQGTALGYGGQQGSGAGSPGILNSIAIAFDLYTVANSVGLYTDGATPTGSQVATGLNFGSGHLFNVALSYNGTTLTFSMTDATTSANFTTSFTVNIPSIVGGSAAYVGFTAACGGATANQFVKSFTFTQG